MSDPQSNKRQRSARACDECKKRKKQCNGLLPCGACTSRIQHCHYSGRQGAAEHPANVENPVDTLGDAQNDPPAKRQKESVSSALPQTPPKPTTTTSDNDDSTMEDSSRLLYDQQGRLVYVGESASLSYLKTIRRLVEETLGPSPFTNDGARHMMLESSVSTPPKMQYTYALPDQEATLFLIDSFFSSTAGLVRMFDKESFKERAIRTYTTPLESEPLCLCHLNLVCAIGLQLRKDNAAPPVRERKILERLKSRHGSRSDIMYLNAKHLCDSLDEFENGGLGSVQTLVLKTVYMLTAAKRNSAWAFLGMGVRLAYALGLHKEETFGHLSPVEQETRKNTWYSLYVLDCFLAASLGRPNAINDPGVAHPKKSHETNALIASVGASAMIWDILSRVYEKRKISISLAHSIFEQFYRWNKQLPETLHWQQISIPGQDSDVVLAQLHVNLLYFHGIILLTRPFFLSQITSLLKSGNQPLPKPPTTSGRAPDKSDNLKAFSRACLRSAIHSVQAVQAAFLQGALPKQDPFVISRRYWLFTSALIVTSNVFCPVDSQMDSIGAMQSALNLFRYTSDSDKQARRYLTILESFKDAISQDQTALSSVADKNSLDIFRALFSDNADMRPSSSNAAISGHRSNIQNETPLLAQQSQDIDQTIGLPLQVMDSMDESGKINAGPVRLPDGSLITAASESESYSEDIVDFDSFWRTGKPVDGQAPNEPWFPLYNAMDLI